MAVFIMGLGPVRTGGITLMEWLDGPLPGRGLVDCYCVSPSNPQLKYAPMQIYWLVFGGDDVTSCHLTNEIDPRARWVESIFL